MILDINMVSILIIVMLNHFIFYTFRWYIIKKKYNFDINMISDSHYDFFTLQQKVIRKFII